MADELPCYSVPFSGCYWVLPGRFLAGKYPGAADEAIQERRLTALARSGIDVCIDLTEENELPPYEPAWLRQVSEYARVGGYFRFGVKDYGLPSADLTRAVLEKLEALLAAGRNVYLHCWGGTGRTGTLVGCYLAQHGFLGEKALQELARLREPLGPGASRSPETPAQIEWVRAWKFR